MSYHDKEPIGKDKTAELAEAVNFLTFFLSAFAQQTNSSDPRRASVRRLLRFIQADYVSIDGASSDGLPESIGYSHEIIRGKHRFKLDVSPVFIGRMKSSGVSIRQETERLTFSTVSILTKKIGDALSHEAPVMGKAEYEELVAKSGE
ncbi:MAG: hypothetical protein HYT08_03860 [Candidatus Levybacteria bacterium]|nr:hypothetical protein [Candidatus Levybacteria bacterium]